MTDAGFKDTRVELGALATTPFQRTLLDEAQIRSWLAILAGWTSNGKRIEKTFTFANYYETMAFVNAAAWIAHRADHHPDLTVGYNRCTVAYSTHDAGGVTLTDCICAARIELLRTT